MANWGIASGIGQGIMQGLQFNRQLDADKRTQQALENQTALVEMKREDHAYETKERDRKGRVATGFQNTMKIPGLTDAERYSRFVADYGFEMTPNEHLEMKKVVDPMVDIFGKQAIDQAVFGKDLAGVQKVVGMRFPGATTAFSSDGSKLLVTTPDAQSTEFAWDDFAKTYGIKSYVDAQAARSKAALDARKTLADIRLKEADANLKDRLPQDRLLPGGTGSSGAGRGGKQQPDPSAMFSADAYLERFGVGKDSDPAFRARGDDGFGFYQMLHKANPRLASTPDGNEMMFRLSRDIMNGSVQRDIKFDPNTMSWNRYVTDSQGGRYKLDRSSIDPRQLKGPDGKPAIEPSVIEQEEMSALKQFSTSRPDKYRLAASLAQAKELTTDELLAAANGMPVSSGSRSVSLSPELANVALMIRRRGMEQPGQKRFVPGGVKRALPDTAGYGAGGSKGTSLAGEAFDKYVADPVTGFFKESARQAREE